MCASVHTLTWLKQQQPRLLPAGDCRFRKARPPKTRGDAFARTWSSSSSNEMSPDLKYWRGSCENCPFQLVRCRRCAKCQLCEDQGEESCQDRGWPQSHRRSEPEVEREQLIQSDKNASVVHDYFIIQRLNVTYDYSAQQSIVFPNGNWVIRSCRKWSIKNCIAGDRFFILWARSAVIAVFTCC